MRSLRATVSRLSGQSEGANEARRLIGVQAHEVPDLALTATHRGDQVASPAPAVSSIPGEVLCDPFAGRHGVPIPTMKDHRKRGMIHGTARPIASRPGQMRHTFTIEQQREAVTYWRSAWEPSEGNAYHECDVPACVCHELLPQ